MLEYLSFYCITLYSKSQYFLVIFDIFSKKQPETLRLNKKSLENEPKAKIDQNSLQKLLK